jgi:diaminohydroxyphosphoribosylaminopyrimidine deaminase/5-amino-6-(5-phosphoribosylamino)uracil reductase
MDEQRLMDEAVRLAAPTHPHPNPRVGAVVVDRAGRVVASASHAGAGAPHAEALALAEAGDSAAGGTLVVTLEPCVHEGRTPPCSQAIIAAGVRRVVIGAEDPDRRVGGRGIAALREAGIEVAVHPDRRAVEALDPGYFHHRRTGLPRVTLKAALTLDGQVAAADGTSRWITGEAARQDGHRLRSAADAVMVGAGTLLADDPRLTVRLPGYAGRQPRPVVVAGERPLPPDAAIWERDPMVLAPRPIETPGGEVLVVPGDGGVDLREAMTALGERGVVDLLVEGGPALGAAMVRAGLVQQGVFYLAGRLAGGVGFPAFAGRFATLADARRVAITGVEELGGDVRVEFVLEED